MGKFILCSGFRALKPYYIKAAGIHVYTIEELCFYLYDNIYLIFPDFFSDGLIAWLEQETKLPELARQLSVYKEENAELKEFVLAVFCCTDYFCEKEVKDILCIMDQIEGMSLAKRRRLRADQYLDGQKYMLAAKEYNSIIGSREASAFTSEEYGNLLHNFAIALLYIGTFQEASVKFEEAYQLNHNPETLRLYLIVLKMAFSQKQYEKRLEMLNISPGEENAASVQWEKWKEEEENHVSHEFYLELQQLEENQDAGELFQRLDEMLEQQISRYREKIK